MVIGKQQRADETSHFQLTNDRVCNAHARKESNFSSRAPVAEKGVFTLSSDVGNVGKTPARVIIIAFLILSVLGVI